VQPYARQIRIVNLMGWTSWVYMVGCTHALDVAALFLVIFQNKMFFCKLPAVWTRKALNIISHRVKQPQPYAAVYHNMKGALYGQDTAETASLRRRKRIWNFATLAAAATGWIVGGRYGALLGGLAGVRLVGTPLPGGRMVTWTVLASYYCCLPDTVGYMDCTSYRSSSSWHQLNSV
jgi:hypothetical protein